jgi:guanylate kinase
MSDISTKFPLLIIGPSGVGKSTIISRILNEYPENFALSISITTRVMRNGEVNGVHYFFKSLDEARQMIEADELIEHLEFCGRIYGTPKSEIKRIQK